MPGEELADVIRKDPVVAYPDEPMRVVVYRMAETGLTRVPVIDDTVNRRRPCAADCKSPEDQFRRIMPQHPNRYSA
jgi:CBS domain-containing protein